MLKYLLHSVLISLVSCELLDSDIDWDLLMKHDVKGKMIEHHITPTLVPVPPEGTCHVHFRWGEPEPGETIPDDEDKIAEPTVTWLYKNDTLYTVFASCILDWTNIRKAAEEERNYTINEWHEWVVYNIPNLMFFRGHTLYEYRPCPEPDDINERNLILYLVYEQPRKMRINATGTCNWDEYIQRRNVMSFAKLLGLGNPVAGTFYYVRYDKQRGMNELN